MRKLFIAFTIVLLITPVMSFAQTSQDSILLKALQNKVVSAYPQTATSTTYCVDFNYQASSSEWWTGLAIRNGSGAYNQFTVSFFDANGNISGQGQFQIGPDLGMRVASLEGLLTWGNVPSIGAVFISATKYFTVTMFVGNSAGGFSMIEKTSILL